MWGRRRVWRGRLRRRLRGLRRELRLRLRKRLSSGAAIIGSNEENEEPRPSIAEK